MTRVISRLAGGEIRFPFNQQYALKAGYPTIIVERMIKFTNKDADVSENISEF